MQENLSRYSRQILFSEIGEQGQRKLRDNKVVLVGCGALGTVIANNLVRAGIGELKIIDRDFVELNNLQRQILFDEEDVKRNIPKAIAAVDKLEKINSEVKLEAVVADVNFTNVENLVEGAKLLVDGTDNFEVRFLLNDACVKAKIPWIYGSCLGSYGLTMNIIPGKTPCFRCLFETAPLPGMVPTCDTAGVISPIVNVIAAIETAEAIKYLTGKFKALNKNLIAIDIWEGSFEKFNLNDRKDEIDCSCCKQRKFEFLEGKQGSSITSLCGRDAVQITQKSIGRIDFEKLAERLKKSGKVTFNKYILKFSVNEYEINLFLDSRAIIKGTNDFSVARGLYAKYIGT
ncbi:MAG: ThiF family adenylyltransferase [bacterium]